MRLLFIFLALLVAALAQDSHERRVKVMDPAKDHDHKPKDPAAVAKYKGRMGKVVKVVDVDGVKLTVALDKSGQNPAEEVEFFSDDLDHALPDQDVHKRHDEPNKGDFYVGAKVQQKEAPHTTGEILQMRDGDDGGFALTVRFHKGGIKTVSSRDVHGNVEFYIGGRVGRIEGVTNGRPMFGHIRGMFYNTEPKGDLMLTVEFDTVGGGRTDVDGNPCEKPPCLQGQLFNMSSTLFYSTEKGHGNKAEVSKAREHATNAALDEFKEADKDGNGHIDHKELKAHHEEEDNDHVANIIKSIDTNEDGQINSEEFVASELTHMELRL